MNQLSKNEQIALALASAILSTYKAPNGLGVSFEVLGASGIKLYEGILNDLTDRSSAPS